MKKCFTKDWMNEFLISYLSRMQMAKKLIITYVHLLLKGSFSFPLPRRLPLAGLRFVVFAFTGSASRDPLYVIFTLA